jgi:hypothetical protein
MSEVTEAARNTGLLDASGKPISRGGDIVVRGSSSQAALVVETPGALLPAIIQMARDPSVDVVKLQAIMEMQERLESREAKRQFNEAFAAMEPKLPRIKRNGVVEYPVNKNEPKGPKEKAFNFARYEDLDEGIRPILRQHGFSLSFSTTPRQGDGGGLVVTGTLLHVGGHSEEASIPLPLDTSGGKNNLQAGASTFSYGRRYTTTMLLNIVTEGADDDGKTGGTPYLTMEQIENLIGLLTDTGTDEGKFLATMVSGADSLGDVEQRDFRRLERALMVKKFNMKAPQTEGGKLDKLEQHIGTGTDDAAAKVKAVVEPSSDLRTTWVNNTISDIGLMSHSHLEAFTHSRAYVVKYDTLRQDNPDLAAMLDKAIAKRTQALGPPLEDQ